MENKPEKPSIKKKKPIKTVDTKDFSSDQIRRLLKEVMMEEAFHKKKTNEMEIDAVVSTMEEFLRSFILIGYNMKNEPIAITHAKSQLDADGLYTSLARMFMSINSNGGI